MLACCRPLLFALLVLLHVALAQYPRSSNKYKQLMEEGEVDLIEFLETNPFYQEPTPPPDPTAGLAETKIRPYRLALCFVLCALRCWWLRLAWA